MIQLKNLEDSMHLMIFGHQPQLSSTFSAGPKLSKFFVESSKVMSQSATTCANMVLTAESDKNPGGASSMQKSVLGCSCR